MTAREAEALKPCPFCGEAAQHVDATRILGVHKVIHRCKVVGFIGIERIHKDAAISTWNRRATTSANEALERAAKVVESELSRYQSWDREAMMLTALAAAIRAMKVEINNETA